MANFSKAEREWLNNALKLDIQPGIGKIKFEVTSWDGATITYYEIVKCSFGMFTVSAHFGDNCTAKDLCNPGAYKFINAHCDFPKLKKIIKAQRILKTKGA